MLGGNASRNMVNTVEKNIPHEWNIKEGEQKNIKWIAELGTTSYGGPVVADGKIFVGTNNGKPRNPSIKGDKGVVMCFRESDGKFLWQAVHDKLPNPQENDWAQQGIASTPAVDGNRVYYVSNRCELVCANVEGKQREADMIWQLDLRLAPVPEKVVFPRFLANGSPLVVGDLVFTVTGNGVGEDSSGGRKVVSPQAPSFIAVDKNTGKLVWEDHSPGDKIMDGQWSNPACAQINGQDQVIFPGGDGWLYGFEVKTGKPIWEFDCNPKNAEYKPGGRGNRSYLMATPVVYENKVYVGVGQNPDDGVGVGHLWCLDISKTGDLSPEVVPEGGSAKAEPNKNSGVVWHFGGPAPKGSNRDYVFGRTLSTCAIHDGLVYVAELDGFVHCLDAKSGQHYWEHDMKSAMWSSPYWVDGKVYIGNDDGDMYMFAHGKEKKQLGQIGMDRPIKTPAIAANGVLYIMTDTRLYAIAQK
jgi:outer membrane protein assembly factor BamB